MIESTMQESQILSTFWLISLVIIWGTAVFLTFAEKRTAEHTKWFVAGGVFFPWLAHVLIAWNGFHFEEKPILGWVWPKSESTSIHLGYGPDFFTFGVTAVVGVVLILRALSRPLPRLAAPALLFGYLGFILNWSAQTFGLSLIGLSFAVLSGGMALVGSQRNASDAHWVNQFLKRNVTGLLLAGIGACGLLSLGCPLDFTSVDPNLFSSHAGEPTLVTAALFLLAGLLLIILPITTQSSQATESPLIPIDATLFLSVFPAASALAAFLRFQPHFAETGILPYFGLSVLGLLFVLCIPLYFKRTLQSSFSQFAILFPSLALAAASLSGVWTGYVLTLCFVTFAPVVAQMIDGKKSVASSIVLFLAVFGWMGGFGFSTASGYLEFFDHPDDRLYISGLAVFAMLLIQIQAWRYYFAYAFHAESEESASWVSVPLLLLTLVPLGVFYTATVSGGILPRGDDAVEAFATLPWVKFFAAQVGEREGDRYLMVTVMHFAALTIGLITGAVTQRNAKEAFSPLAEKFPGANRWMERGLGVDLIHDVFMRQGEKLGHHVQVTVSRTVWEKWIPGALGAIENTLGKLGAWIDRASRVFTSSHLRIVIEAPAKLVQLSQNGDIQAYLFFAIFWTLLILVHFIKF